MALGAGKRRLSGQWLWGREEEQVGLEVVARESDGGGRS